MIVEDGIVYLCMTDEELGKRRPYAFLEEVKDLRFSFNNNILK